MSYHVSISNQQTHVPIDEDLLRRAVCLVLSKERISEGSVSLAILDNAAIRKLNAQFLSHDYETDGLSFVLEPDPEESEGEIILSGEMAREQAAFHGWSAESELLLYLVHGTLHLAGYLDGLPEEAAQMRAKEAHYLGLLGIAAVADRETCSKGEPPR